MSELNIADALLEIQEGEVEIEHDIRIAHKSVAEINEHLNDVVERLEESSFNLTQPELFDKLRCFIRDFSVLQPHLRHRVVEILVSGMNAQIDLMAQQFKDPNVTSMNHYRDPMERFVFLIQWLIMVAESRENAKKAEEATTTQRVKRGRGTRKKVTSDADDRWDWQEECIRLLESLRRLVRFRLSRIWETTPELDAFIGLLIRPAYFLMENPDHLKQAKLRNMIYTLIGACVKQHNHGFAAQTAILQNLQYYEHLSQPMADLLATIADQFDHPQIADSVLCEISNKEFNAQDTTGPKNFSKFIVRLSEIAPKLVQKQMVHLSKHLDSESATMRIAVIETIGNIMTFLFSQEPDETTIKQLEAYFDVIEERFRDVSSFCRCKVLQVCAKLCDSRAKFPKRRQRLVDYTIGRLEDKSSFVRANAIKLLTKFVETHPFVMDGGELQLSFFEKKYAEVTEKLEAIVPPEEVVISNQTEGENATKSGELDGDTSALDMEQSGIEDEQSTLIEKEQMPEMEMFVSNAGEQRILDPETAKEYMGLQLQQRYYLDAIHFVRRIHEAIPILCQLLASTNKTEVIDTMDFFVTAHYYKISAAQEGIRKMVHLIWSKDTGSDESKGVRARLIECYRMLYLAPVTALSHKDNVNLIARRLISLTFNTTLAELTSLEQLLATMMNEGHVSDEVIRKLWSVYSYRKSNIPPLQRRGAIIILGMLASAKKEVVTDHVDTLLKIGLGPLGREDLLLAKYTCIALQRLLDTKPKGKCVLEQKQVRFPQNHPIFSRIREVIEAPCTLPEWFSVAEQAINTIYLLGEHPDIICTEIIRAKAAQVFNLSPSNETTKDASDADATMSMNTTESMDTTQEACVTSPYELSQLLFVAGHVAIKQIVHLEMIEAELKRRKAEETERKKKEEKEKKEAQGDDELEQVTGTAEDDVAEAIARIRERELLYGRNSLLTIFGPMAAYVCANNKTFNNVTLQTAATIAMAKFMCVSAEYCERHLPLLLTILEKSSEPTIRSNIIIALGDIAVCFNNLIEQNISYLYKRLSDSDLSVKKNALMVLTHLILNGMVKVKGQLGEMAKCIDDPDQRISDLAKLFFTELASKDNAVYNNLPDIISHLSVGANAIEEQKFNRIMKFLFEFIKDKHADNIVDKLCLRFKNAEHARQWRDTGFCLSQLPFRTERSLKKLLDAVPLFADKLHDATLYKYFTEIVQKARLQKIQRSEVKLLIDDLERKINEHHEASDSKQEAIEKAEAVKTRQLRKATRTDGKRTAASKKKTVKTEEDVEMADADDAAASAPTTRSTRGRASNAVASNTKRRGRGRQQSSSEESSDEEMMQDLGETSDEDSDVEMEDVQVLSTPTTTRSGRTVRPRQTNRHRVIEETSEDESMEEDSDAE